MPTLEEVAKQPVEQRLGRMSRTADDLATAIRSQSEAALVRRPGGKAWAPNEIICHLRDIEEVFVAAVLFGVAAVQIFAGIQVMPTTAPLPLYAYPVLVATFLGWIWTILRVDDRPSANPPAT